MTYTYNNGTNGTGNLLDKHDAKGQDTVYTYDSLNRVTETQRYPNGKSNGEDTCARVTYTYDTNPVNSSFSKNSTGRLTTAQYAVPNSVGRSSGCASGVQAEDLYTEMYSYLPAGAVTAKNLQMQRTFYNPSNNPYTATGSVEADYTYDSAGRTLTVANPAGGAYNGNTFTPATLTYSYDTMGRPSGLTTNLQPYPGVSNVQYDYASRMAGLSYVSNGSSSTKAWSYNVNGQTASLNWSGNIVNGGIQYVYSATQNNGQITQAVDTLSGETISYQYDALKRLTSAASTVAGTQTYQYDGFGNLTAKVLNGSSTPIPVNAATNQLTNAGYDANGNMTSGAGATLTYDEANRISAATETSGGAAYYGYSPDNKRIYVNGGGSAEQWTLYGAKGEKLGVFGINNPACPPCGSQFTFAPQGMSVWFAGKLIQDSSAAGAQPVAQDRLGTNRVNGARFRPYGDEITSTANDREKFATYTRDSYTGFDYADQRFYASTYGRFNTPDPYQASGGPSNPGSWNRYTYVKGDPINIHDPTGLDGEDPGYCDVYGNPNGPNGYDPNCDPNNPTAGGGSGGGLPSCSQFAAGMGWTQTQLSDFLTITADAALLNINLSGFSVSGPTGMQIAGGQGPTPGVPGDQTEMVATGNQAALASLLSSMCQTSGYNASMPNCFAAAGFDLLHAGTPGSQINFRQDTPTYPMQISGVVNANGSVTLDIDIDPNNPMAGLRRGLGHAGNVLQNMLSGRDTDYTKVAQALNINPYQNNPYCNQ